MCHACRRESSKCHGIHHCWPVQTFGCIHWPQSQAVVDWSSLITWLLHSTVIGYVVIVSHTLWLVASTVLLVRFAYDSFIHSCSFRIDVLRLPLCTGNSCVFCVSCVLCFVVVYKPYKCDGCWHWCCCCIHKASLFGQWIRFWRKSRRRLIHCYLKKVVCGFTLPRESVLLVINT